MTKIDWSAINDPSAKFRSGTYLVEVTDVEERVSKSAGESFLFVALRAADFGCELFRDNIMLEGRGARIGLTKLQGLGFDTTDTEINAADLIGRRAFVAVQVEEHEGKTRLSCDIRAGGNCGYWPADSEPDGVLRPAEGSAEASPADSEDETPF